MRWTRRRTVIGGGIRGDHWAILCNGVQVGSTYYAVNISSGRNWVWSVHTYPAVSGGEPSLDAALDKARQAVLASDGRIDVQIGREKRLW